MDETQDQPSDSGSPRKRGLKSEMIVAIAAIAVSIMTLFVYIYQARIMMDQQHTSVWPYVEWESTNINTETEQEYYIEVVNKGVGPALVKDTKLTLDGVRYDYVRDMAVDLLGKEKID